MSGVNQLKNKIGEILSCSDIAEYLDVHIRTVQRMIQKGELKGVKVGKGYRIKEEDFMKWFNDNYGKTLK